MSLGISRRFFRLAAYERARRALRRECAPVSSALHLGKPVQSEVGVSKKKKPATRVGFLLRCVDKKDAMRDPNFYKKDAYHSISVISILGNNLSCFLSTPAYFPIKATSN